MAFFKKDYFLGDKAFYRSVIAIALPIIIQQTVTNAVNLLDNIMVGRVGELEYSAVGIINQLMVIVNLSLFGALSAAGIFASQYSGAKNDEGLRHTFRIKLVAGAIILAVASIVLGFFPDKLAGLYIAEGTSLSDTEKTIGFASEYVRIMLIGLIPFTLSQVYAQSLKEIGETKLPMYASVMAIFVNLGFNYLLIFGSLGFPRLGIAGAAIATVISRFAEMVFLIALTHRRKNKYTFIDGVYKSFYVPKPLIAGVIKKGIPLLANEFLWSTGIAMYLQCYSVRGLDVVAASTIASAVSNFFGVMSIAVGMTVAVMVGQCLGEGDFEKAKRTAWRLIVFGTASCLALGLVLVALSGVIPSLYKTSDSVRSLASTFLCVIALSLPLQAFSNGAYFTLRSGGKTMITFWLDSGFMWLVAVPAAFVLANYTSLKIEYVYLTVQCLDLIKCFIGVPLIQSGMWLSNIVEDKK